MLIVPAVTSTSVNRITPEIDRISSLMLPNMDTNPSWKFCSVSVSVSASEFSNSASIRSIKRGTAAALCALTQYNPVNPRSPSSSSKYS